jgi:hypothetical protein
MSRYHFGFSRRDAVKQLGASFLLTFESFATIASEISRGQNSPALDRSFDAALLRLGQNATLVEQLRSDRADYIAAASGQERAPSLAPPSKTLISQRASSLIMTCEIGSQRRYEKMYSHPTWPKGESGITIGIGYDIGYSTPDGFLPDWHTYLKNEEIATLTRGCGIFGARARDLLQIFDGIQIPWATAEQQFFHQTLPRYIGATERALPNCSLLSRDSLGALVSLVYNRGPAFAITPERDPENRFSEMREIKALMNQRFFEKIPEQMILMKRIWVGQSDMKGLLVRRDLEAALFVRGLSSNGTN